ncbi:hypothetical protein E8E13_007234 [Curvularia kusanoi]|uniref:Uncharacterized protein n=1 Tax=Curvularia kusanoi TaxID=90978 RepID=A0A9P4TC99_CURKU|nr:hypothetical protein E8E13_007234 [Curvularia kusanoi]
MVRSCMSDFAQLGRLISSYFITHSPPEVTAQQACDLGSIPYTTWKPPTCSHKCQGMCPHLPFGDEVRVNGRLVTGTTDSAIELYNRGRLAGCDDTTAIGFADKHTTFSTVLDTLNQTLTHARVIANGNVPCVPSTRNADAHCTTSHTPSTNLPDAQAEDKGKMPISKATSQSQTRHGISRTAAEAHTTHQQSIDLSQGPRNPFDDAYSLSDEDEDLYDTIALTDLRPEALPIPQSSLVSPNP